MRRFTRTCRMSDSGFTLLELMIVLALLAFLAAIAWPALRRPLLRSVTQQAARQLATDLSRARLNAIETQRTMVVRYEPGAARYSIVPADTLSDTTESRDAADDQFDTLDVTDEVPTTDDLEISAQLDADVFFQDPAAVPDNDIPVDSALGQSLRDEMQQTEEVQPLIQDTKEETIWSPPIMVYPTGRAENAQFVLRGPDGYSVTVTLRGLTGAVTVGPLVHELRTTPGTADQDLPGSTPRRDTSRTSELPGVVE